ncbi:MAG TPA: CAP domain-containing protein [Allosphingosinicella sp.]|nr:CAP domain-containing protein [Allosphingosinicella sp.]
MILRPILIAAAAMLAQSAETQPPVAEAPAPSTLEQQVLDGINEARTNPAAYAEKLKRYRGYFDGDVVHLPGSDVGLRTREGVAAVDQAIAVLSKQAPLPPLRHAPELDASARLLASHQGLVGGMGHAAADGSDAKARIKRHKGSGLTAEVLAYGTSDAAAVVRQLIVDDGVPSRPNRKILLESKYRRAGVACGSHPVNRSICVVDLATFVGLNPNPKQVRNPPPTVDFQ